MNCRFSVGAEQSAFVLTRTNSIPKGSAFIDKTVVSNLKPGPRGENVIWDFTDVEVLDGNVKCEYEVIGDSVLYVTEGGPVVIFACQATLCFVGDWKIV